MVPVLHEDDSVHALHEAVLVHDGDSRLFPQNAVVPYHPVSKKCAKCLKYAVCRTSDITDQQSKKE